MNIRYLPSEIIDLFFHEMNDYSILTIQRKNIIVKNNKNIFNIAASRIKLWWKIIKKYTIQKNHILNVLKKCFSYDFYNLNGYIYDCVYYTPYIPGGICRFCSKKENKHLLKEKVILKYYYPLFKY